MTEPSPARPIPGPPRPGPSTPPAVTEADPTAAERAPFEGLAELPVADHVAVFEEEHDRLQRELSTIDRL
jgi:hypothetical protein